MDTTRRMFVGISTAAAATAAAGIRPVMAATATNKDKFWIAGVTPCDKNYEFDAGAYREQFQWWKSQGAEGVLVLGTNGEGPSFSVAERKRIAEYAMKNNAGLDLIITTGTANYKETLDLTQHAAAIGAAHVLVHPPFYFKNPAGAGVLDYFNLILDKANTKVMYYHIPRVTGVPVDVSVIQKLAEHPNFAGVKNSNAIPEEFETFSSQTPNRLNIISGTDNNMLAALKHGNGVILGSGNVYTKLVAGVFAAHRAGQDPTPAYNKLVDATKLMQANGYGSNYNAIKYSLNLMMGVNRVSLARPPHVALTDQEMARLRTGVQQLKAMT